MRAWWAVLLTAAIVAAGCGTKKTETPAPLPTPAVVKPEPKAEEPPAPPPPEEKPAERKPEKPPRPAPELAGAVGVMVENSRASRPQAGLERADLVYELEAEYGITRFLAFFHSRKAEKIGPVRSARMGFYEVVKAYGVPYGHAGGNPDVHDALHRDQELADLDDIYTCGPCFWRSNDRRAPHNLYTNTDRLLQQAAGRGHKPAPLFLFPEGELAGGAPAGTVQYSWGPQTEYVAWAWNGSRYERSQSGEAHLVESGERLAVENVVVLATMYVWVEKGEWQHDVTIVGAGEGMLFRDGLAWPIRWEKKNRNAHYRLTLADGSSAALLASGQTWVSVLKSMSHLRYGN
jgi:hypothetical protein